MSWLKLAPYVAALAVVAGAAWWFYDAGRDAVVVEDLKATIKTQKRIDDADAAGPRTPDDVDKRLRDGNF